MDDTSPKKTLPERIIISRDTFDASPPLYKMAASLLIKKGLIILKDVQRGGPMASTVTAVTQISQLRRGSWR